MTGDVFGHGVASGDPLPDGVVIWTRVSPRAGVRRVAWKVARSPGLERPVAEGTEHAAEHGDFTVKVDVRGLEPGTTYHFGFECDGAASVVGRTRTAPAPAAPAVRIGLVSCAHIAAGWFCAYRHLARREVDLVLHVGDYLYEDARRSALPGRGHRPGRRLVTLADYRARHAQYKEDPDLQTLHRRHPVVAVWDDHEIAGDAWRGGAAAHDPAVDGGWEARKAAAVRAYLEWMPVRVPDPAEPDRIFRRLALGDLVDLVVLDTRLHGRDRPAGGDGGGPELTVDDPGRSLLGAQQRRWLQVVLSSSRATWRILASQVMVAPLRVADVPVPLRPAVRGLVAGGLGVNPGQWDGYPAEREALLRFLATSGIGDVVVLSGDIHASWAAELRLGEGDAAAPVAVEFVAPSVTADTFADLLVPRLPGARALARRAIVSQNGHLRFSELSRHGYVLVDVSAERVRASWWHVDRVDVRDAGERLAATWEVRAGDARLRGVGGSDGDRPRTAAARAAPRAGLALSAAFVVAEGLRRVRSRRRRASAAARRARLADLRHTRRR